MIAVTIPNYSVNHPSISYLHASRILSLFHYRTNLISLLSLKKIIFHNRYIFMYNWLYQNLALVIPIVEKGQTLHRLYHSLPSYRYTLSLTTPLKLLNTHFPLYNCDSSSTFWDLTFLNVVGSGIWNTEYVSNKGDDFNIVWALVTSSIWINWWS